MCPVIFVWPNLQIRKKTAYICDETDNISETKPLGLCPGQYGWKQTISIGQTNLVEKGHLI